MAKLPAEAARAVFLCTVGTKFGCGPHEVGAWPASAMRMLELNAVVETSMRERAKDG